jgi:alpha-glucosidase
VYGAYHPYVPPAPNSVIGSRPRLPSVALDTEAAPPPVDPDSLPGFSTRPKSAAGNEEKTINVAVEDGNPDSLLNFYRRVLELHSGNATLRTGSVSFLNHDSEGALVWLRRAPAGARTVASVIVVCNMTDRPINISLASDLAHLHIRSGYVRPLLTSRHVDHVAQSIGSVRVSANSVYIGELRYR